MSELSRTSLVIHLAALFLLCLQCSSSRSIAGSALLELERDILSPDISPDVEPQPLLPLLAPSPLMPFANNGIPKLSGLCLLNFSAEETVLSKTAIDCWASFAPYLANVVCCPQFNATLSILIGQFSKYSGKLALNMTHAKHCLSDVEQILEAQGSIKNLHKLCSISPSNLTGALCPVISVNEIDSILDSSKLLAACGKIDPANECCNQVCRNAIWQGAEKIASRTYSKSSLDGTRVLPERYLNVIEDCRSIVLRWLASKLDSSSSNGVLRGLSSCNINKECPLVFPGTRNVTKECADVISNRKACCYAMKSYVSGLQEQSLITNFQALNCAALLGLKVQRANVSSNVYDLCQIKLKDFSLQVASQDSGCLLPSLPSDATFDKTYGISFICDLNDNVAAPWPSGAFQPASLCNRTVSLPTLPKVTSAQSGLYGNELMFSLLFASSSSLVLRLLI